jgi:hypothetical protein
MAAATSEWERCGGSEAALIGKIGGAGEDSRSRRRGDIASTSVKNDMFFFFSVEERWMLSWEYWTNIWAGALPPEGPGRSPRCPPYGPALSMGCCLLVQTCAHVFPFSFSLIVLPSPVRPWISRSTRLLSIHAEGRTP